MELEEKTIESRYVYEGRIVNMRVDVALLPNGKRAGREVVEHSGGVAVLPVLDSGEILLVQQFRYPYKEVIWEIPAGKMEKDEQPIETARRELSEECSHRAGEYIYLDCIYPTPGYLDEKIHIYIARGLVRDEGKPDEDEFLNVGRFTLDEAVDMVMNGTIRDAKSAVGILKYKLMERL